MSRNERAGDDYSVGIAETMADAAVAVAVADHNKTHLLHIHPLHAASNSEAPLVSFDWVKTKRVVFAAVVGEGIVMRETAVVAVLMGLLLLVPLSSRILGLCWPLLSSLLGHQNTNRSPCCCYQHLAPDR